MVDDAGTPVPSQRLRVTEDFKEGVKAMAERKAFLTDRKGAIVGRKLATKYGWRVGDQIPLRGTIYPGAWTFTLRGIYDGADRGTDVSTMYMHWELLNETIKRLYPRRGDQTGVFVVQLRDPADAAEVSAAIDAMFTIAPMRSSSPTTCSCCTPTV